MIMIKRKVKIIMVFFFISLIDSCTISKHQHLKDINVEYLTDREALEFNFQVKINCSQEIVFRFFSYIDEHKQSKDSPVIFLEKISDGPPGVGTQYLEKVKMLPLVKGKFLSEITCYELNDRLEQKWIGGGMKGYIIYTFETNGNETLLKQKEYIKPTGVFNLFRAFIEKKFAFNASNRLIDIKNILEAKCHDNETFIIRKTKIHWNNIRKFYL